MLRSQRSRQAITLELVAAHAPSHALVGRLCSTFGLDPVDYEGIRETTKDQISLSAEALQPTVNETAMKIHLQRVVGSFVSSAHGAAQFYGGKVTQARDLTSKLANDDRDRTARGFMDLRAAPPAPASSPPKRAYRLRVRSMPIPTSPARRGSRTSRRSPAPPPSAARRRKPKSPLSGETVRAGVARPRLASPPLPLDGP